MKKFLFVFSIAIALLAWSCGGSSESSAEAAEGEQPAAETAAPETPAQNVAASGANYQITVLDAGQASPRKEMKGTIGGVEVTVNYGSPSVKGRKIWGGLEDYDQVWRTGANEATRITFSQDVTINGEKLPAGTYGLFTIPSESGEWTVIFNEVAEQWGSGNYDESKDVLRVKTQAGTAPLAEQLDFFVDGDQVVMRWEKVSVPFTVVGA